EKTAVAAYRLGRRIAGYPLECRVGINDRLIRFPRIGDDDAVIDRLQAALEQAQLFLCLLAQGDIAQREQPRRAPFPPGSSTMNLSRAGSAIEPSWQTLIKPGMAAGYVIVLLQQLLRCGPKQLFRRGIGVKDRTILLIDHQHRIAQITEQLYESICAPLRLFPRLQLIGHIGYQRQAAGLIIELEVMNPDADLQFMTVLVKVGPNAGVSMRDGFEVTIWENFQKALLLLQRADVQN